jgi:hypothetical protein
LREPVEFSPSSQVPALPDFQIKGLESDELDDGELGDETEGLLDRFHGLGRGHGRGLKPATVVGTGRNDSDWLIKLVAGISKRLVLRGSCRRLSLWSTLATFFDLKQLPRNFLSPFVAAPGAGN